jgi:hypothetical protein
VLAGAATPVVFWNGGNDALRFTPVEAALSKASLLVLNERIELKTDDLVPCLWAMSKQTSKFTNSIRSAESVHASRNQESIVHRSAGAE